ncbi:MAG: DUF2147 domain-containing protein [Proteobacteria bacterium]|nr:DUF2147 domain-containing protein [Pseudomonadota bacterium]MDA1155684.1 DUF2147 domain-containing protein [Pseudomonadota bacterium]
MTLERRSATKIGQMLSGAFLALALLAGLWLPTAAQTSETDPAVLGLWLTEKKKVLIEFYPCANEVCGRIVWLGKPYLKSGELRRDTHNSDPSLRSRGWCGIEVVKGLEPEDGKYWENGKFYNPKDGSTYDLDLGPVRGDTIKALLNRFPG